MLYKRYKCYRIRERKEGISFLKRFIEKNKQISALFEQFKNGQYSLSIFQDAITYQTWL